MFVTSTTLINIITMKRNKLLTFAIYFFRLVQVFLIIGFITSIFLLFVYQFYPDKFSNYRFNPATSEIDLIDIKIFGSENESNDLAISINEVKPVTIYLLFLQLIAIFVLTWLAIKEFINVIRSLQQWQTFSNYNVEAFRKMGTYFVVIFILSNISFYLVGNKGKLSFDLDLTFGALALVSFILAEIFKEGNRLYEEEQLTV